MAIFVIIASLQCYHSLSYVNDNFYQFLFKDCVFLDKYLQKISQPQIFSSLGGVFITTMVGLVIAMIILAFEVYFHKKEQKNNVRDISGKDLGGQFNTNYGNNAGGNGNR